MAEQTEPGIAPAATEVERAGLSPAFSRYEHTLDKWEMTIEEAEQLSADLARLARLRGFKFDIVVGIANGALLPMRVAARQLELPEEIVRVRRQGSRIKQRLLAIKNALRIPSGWLTWGPLMPIWVWFQNRTGKLEGDAAPDSGNVSGKRVLLVDDCLESGRSVELVRRRLLDGGAASVTSAVICWTLMPDPAVLEPDIYLHRTTQYYPWSGSSRYWGDFLAWLEREGLVLWQ